MSEQGRHGEVIQRYKRLCACSAVANDDGKGSGDLGAGSCVRSPRGLGTSAYHFPQPSLWRFLSGFLCSLISRTAGFLSYEDIAMAPFPL